MHCRVEATLTGNTDGTWRAFGTVISHKDGEVFESPLGTHVFTSEDAGRDWLLLLGKAVGTNEVSILVRRPPTRHVPDRAPTRRSATAEPATDHSPAR